MPNGGYLTRQQILDAKDINFAEVSVPEWGGVVRIKSLGSVEKEEYETRLYRIGRRFSQEGESEATMEINAFGVRTLICALTICDEHGNRLFGEDEIAVLGKKSAKALDRVFEASKILSGLTPEAESAAGEGSDAAAEQGASSKSRSGPAASPDAS